MNKISLTFYVTFECNPIPEFIMYITVMQCITLLN